MGSIRILDFQVANLIAAGEVVERPASAVKELLENSIDAEATEITVEIKRGGTAFIRVSDNGCGMSAEDLPTALMRHATSKISVAADLDRIVTLGFRGEALAAISSVAKVRIITKRKQDVMGNLLTCEFGRVTDISETGCREGTTVIVEELFANVPARRKFLKKDSSEAAAVISIVEKIALSHPEIAVKMINNGEIVFNTQGDNNLMSSVYSVLGKDFASKLIKVDFLTDGIEIFGYIGSPLNVRANRNYQIFFINGRYIRSKTATAALEQAFDSYLEAGKFPTCVLFVSIHPALVDVNVHPTKLEVKFSNEKTVFEAIYCAVRNAILSSTERPELIFESEHMEGSDYGMFNAFVPVEDRVGDKSAPALTVQQMLSLPVATLSDDEAYEKPSENGTDGTDGQPASVPERAAQDSEVTYPPQTQAAARKVTVSDLWRLDDLEDEIPAELAVGAKSEEKSDDQDIDERLFSLGAGTDTSNCPVYKILGVAFNTYITVETGGKILIVDKHAAHERILFEQMKKINRSQRGAGQLMMLPLEARLSPEELEALSAYKSEIEEIGYKIELVPESGSLLIMQIPSSLSEAKAKDMLVCMAGRLADGSGNIETTKESFFEQALYQASCKAATKGGWIDSEVRIKWIVESVLSNPDIRYCPHGRPIAIEVTKSEIEKIFKRI